MNVFWLRFTHANPVTVNDLETVSNGIVDLWGSDLSAAITNNVSVTECKLSFIKAAGESLDYVHTETKTGGNANVIPDAAACVVINWHTGQYYRGGHPRSYIPGPQANHIVNGSTLDASLLSAMASGASAWLNHINALTSTNITQVEMGTVRFVSQKAWLSPPIFVPYTSASARTILGTQRRRLVD